MLVRVATVLCCVVVHLLLLGCGVLRPPEPYEAVRPQTPPERNITSFTESLRCLDALFAAHGLGAQGIGTAYVTSQGVLDKTGKGIGGDNLDVLISTISKTSAQSGTFRFVHYDPRNLIELNHHIILLHGGDVGKFTWASYEIIAAITQLDENVDARSLAMSLALPIADIGGAKDLQASVLSVDFNVSNAVNRQVLNGITASNTIAIFRRGMALDGGGFIKKVGLFLNVSLDKNEGVYAALRALIELSTIEVLGKITKVPYWRCLQIEQSNPEVQAMTRDWFASMQESERITFVQRMLAQRGYYRGAVTETLDTATQEAIARYQAATDLIPSGRIDLALYRRLISEDRYERVTPEPETVGTPAPTPVPTPEPARLVLTLTTPRGMAPVYAVNERLSLSVQVSQDAYLYCFYRDGHLRIGRVYPNRFQQGAFARANQRVTIPEAAPFSLLLDTPNTTEVVLCVASPEDLETQLPPHLRPDLEVLSVTSLQEVLEVFRRLVPDGLAQAQLLAQVSTKGRNP